MIILIDSEKNLIDYFNTIHSFKKEKAKSWQFQIRKCFFFSFLVFKLWKYDKTLIGDLENVEQSYI